MADYTLEGVKWGDAALGTGSGTITWSTAVSVPTSFLPVLTAAFADWAQYAPLTFVATASTGGADIRFSSDAIDGIDNILGETSYTSGADSTVLDSASIDFDSGEGWHKIGSAIVSDDGVNLMSVALHEIGHALGLDHYNGAPAIMNAELDRSITDLTQSDIDGIRAIYGAVGANDCGQTVHTVSSTGGELYALYDEILGRAPDPLGMESFEHSMEFGMSLHDAAQCMLQSGEFTAKFGSAGQLSDKDFIERLYETGLHRQGDAAGLATHLQALAGGMSRADMAIAFALSPEHVGIIQPALTSGVFVPDQTTADVARLYYATLDRAPDLGGLQTYAGAIKAGASLDSIASGLLNSAEFHTRFGAPTDSAFVQDLYHGALGRTADAGGLTSYTMELQHGVSRADVAQQLAQSTESKVFHMSAIETGSILT